MTDDLVMRLEECALGKQQEAWDRLDGGQDLSIGAMLAEEAAATLHALSARVAELEAERDRIEVETLERASQEAQRRRHNDNTGSPMLDLANAGRNAEAGEIAAAIRALKGGAQ